MTDTEFKSAFHQLTGNAPYPWQSELFRQMRQRPTFIPAACEIPTGLGKTSVIAVWLLARKVNPALPRRLVYVVNRRTVVDQTTDEVRKILDKIAEHKLGIELEVSTLRGQFADNRKWSADPSKAAVICGTVDMIGSRLLFSGYGVGFKAKPLHAGFLGQDVLLVHDEAHLEEPFQRLIKSVEQMQAAFKGERVAPAIRVMALTATPRDAGDPLRISAADREAAKDRLDAVKHLTLIPADKDADAVAKIIECAHALNSKNRAVLIFVRTVEAAKKVVDGLRKKKVSQDSIALLTGTIRGKERDELVGTPVFKRFLPSAAKEVAGTVYLVCTSAGEVGVNISADDLVSDLSTFDSMAQRFGRLNRFGRRPDSTAVVIHPTTFKADDPLDQRREKTLRLLKELDAGLKSVSPNSIGTLSSEGREDAFAPTPECLHFSEILTDAWSLTSIRGRMPGRPDVEPYLHGISDQEPETRVAWREEVGVITGTLLDDHPPRELLDVYELKPHEMLRDTSRRVFKELQVLAERHGDRPVWLVDDFGEVDPKFTLATLTARDETPIRNRTVLLPHNVGGLTLNGMLDGAVQEDVSAASIGKDVADQLVDQKGDPLRLRVDDENDERAARMRRLRTIRWPKDESDQTDVEPRTWFWFERPVISENSRNSVEPIELEHHVGDVERKAEDILSRLALPPKIADAIAVAAKHHDLGKARERWQASIGRPPNLSHIWYAKSGRSWNSRREGAYRHEFGSLLDVTAPEKYSDFESLDAPTRDLVLHLIATHHGMARPHFEADQTLDDNHPADAADALSLETLRRYARLQRRFGHWGLAYIESILRAADWHASAYPTPKKKEAGR